MTGLLAIADDYCSQHVEEYGRYTLYPVLPGHRQRFYKSLGDGIHLEIRNSVPDALFSWGALIDVIEGLTIFVVHEQHFSQCYFRFYDGLGVPGIGQIAADDNPLPYEVS